MRGEGMEECRRILERFGLTGEQPGAMTGLQSFSSGDMLECVTPITGERIGYVRCAGVEDYHAVVQETRNAYREWRDVPAPKRGELVRHIGNALRECKEDLGSLITVEMGKIRAEGEGEVQEMIDMADFAVGLSRMLYGSVIPSERPRHRMYEQWHPLGPVGVVTAFNFPVAVWAWNAMIALVCGNPVIWKPSSKAPLSAIATMKIIGKVIQERDLPKGLLGIVVGSGSTVGEALINDGRVPLVSATGSVKMGRRVEQCVAERLGKTILELGGNNAVIITNNADLSLAVRAVLFGAIGTAGQRCTTTRRLIVHRDVAGPVRSALIDAYSQISIGNPLERGILMGPLVDKTAVNEMERALEALKEQGGKILYGGERLTGGIFDAGTYVRPCICEVRSNMAIVGEETFAPVLYLITYDRIDEAISYQNAVPQGLSSAIFTKDIGEAEYFLSAAGSDCGIANVNAGTSGAEIGGAFGGEKETGGGREAGSDAWKAYMRRQTCTINWSEDLPLSQGIRFGIGQ